MPPILVLLALTLPNANPGQNQERTCFQTALAHAPDFAPDADVAIVYGIDPGIVQRAKTWRDQGYRIHVMTGIAWGNYRDYTHGKWDGRQHLEDAQVDGAGKPLLHGGSKDMFYMMPSEPYVEFLCERVRHAIDAGAHALHLEEPEFWCHAGYSEGFKKEWAAHYSTAWVRPDSSPDAWWKAARLKQTLYQRALKRVFTAAKTYAKEKGRDLRCYVPTHSPLNYAQFGIVSPEATMADMDIFDGYIGQVWTGTARIPNRFNNVGAERVFETAYLEYGSFSQFARAGGRRIWFLADPVEDNPNRDWNDYRTNFHHTLAASLLFPNVWHYEIMPWPSRVFRGKYPKSHGSDERITIPDAYRKELHRVFAALRDMKQDAIQWHTPKHPIGIVVSDSMLFHSRGPWGFDHTFPQFYGLALPLLKRGIAVEPVQLEFAVIDKYLDRFRCLVLSYEFIKPLRRRDHEALIAWCNAGGSLIVVGDGADAFFQIDEWWSAQNKTGREFYQRLMASLASGKGHSIWLQDDPANYTKDKSKADAYVATVQRLYEKAKTPADPAWAQSRYFHLARGPYHVGHVLDETGNDRPVTIKGRFENLFAEDPARVEDPVYPPGESFFLRRIADE